MKRLKLLLLLCVFVSVSVVHAADSWQWRAGLFGAATLNLHNGEFSSYEGLQECGEFSDATTLGWTVGNFVDVRFNDKWGATARLGYWQADGTFTDPAPVAPKVSLPDGSLVTMVSEYELKTTLDVITLDLLATYQLFPRFFIGLGPHIGYTSRAAFEQFETIIEPSGITFADGSTSRLILAAPFEQSGAVSTTTELRLGVTLNLGYDIAVSKRVDVTPEIGGTYAFTDVLSSFPWQVNMVRAGVRVSYLFGDDDAPPPPPPPAEAPPPAVVLVAPYVLLDVVGVNENGATESVSEIVLSESTSVDVMPLLPNIFFDSVSAVIPSRYVARTGNTKNFLPNEIEGDILNVYHDLLNIVGYRMQQRPNANLSIVGHIEPADGEKDAALATQRATAVRDYLVQTWNIDASRLNVVSRELPLHTSNRTIPDGREENRRVEISSNDLAILAPVRRTSVASKLMPDPLNVMPTVEPASSSSVKVVSADGDVLATQQVEAKGSMTWKPTPALVASMLSSGTRRVTVIASSGTGDQYREARQVIGLRRSYEGEGSAESDTIRERHRLVFFDFDDDKISTVDAPYMEALQARLRTTSKINVTGYTDRIGNVPHNTDLATRRAARVANTIRERIVPEVVRERGAGPELIHNNDLPEGRMYNRTVIIDVATPREALQGEE